MQSTQPKVSDESFVAFQQQLNDLAAKVSSLELKLKDTENCRVVCGRCGHPAINPCSQVLKSDLPSEPRRLPDIAMSKTRVVMHEIVLPGMADFMHICFGGQVLSWIDICAGLAAKAVARGPCVTASVDAVHFLAPLRVGSVAIIAAMVNRTFSSSMEVGVRVEQEDMRSGTRSHCVSAYLTFVSVAGLHTGNSLAPQRQRLPKVVPTTQAHSLTHSEAQRRRTARLQAVSGSLGGPAQEARMRLRPVTHREGSVTLARPQQMKREGGAFTVSPECTSAHMTYLIMPQHANSLGITFGGQILQWMEAAAFVAASRLGRGGRHLLTASMDSIAFRHPTRVGDILYVSAQVTGVFGSSMEVLICVDAESSNGGLQDSVSDDGTEQTSPCFHCGSAFATVVSVAGPWPPVAVPVQFQLQPSTPEEKLRCENAAQRRSDRLEMRKALVAYQSQQPSLDGTPVSPKGQRTSDSSINLYT